jgi:hypothetical protein
MIRSPFFVTVLSFIAAGAVAIVVAIITAIAIERRSIEDVNARCWCLKASLGRRSMPTGCRCSFKAPRPMRRAVFSPNRARVGRGRRPRRQQRRHPGNRRRAAAALLARHAAKRRRHPDHRPRSRRERRRRSRQRDRGHRRRRGSHRHGRDRRLPAAGHMDLGAGLRPARPARTAAFQGHGLRRSRRGRGHQRQRRTAGGASGGSAERTAGRGRGRARHLRAASGLLAVPAACGARCAGASDRQLRRRHAARAGAHHRRRAARRRTGEIDCPIGLGVPSPSWASAVETGLAALVELGGGTLSFSDDRHADRRSPTRDRTNSTGSSESSTPTCPRSSRSRGSFRNRPMRGPDPHVSSRRSTQRTAFGCGGGCRKARLAHRSKPSPSRSSGASAPISRRARSGVPAGLVGACHGGPAALSALHEGQ